MKRYEKIILIIFAVTFLLQLIPFPGITLLFLATWTLAGSYLIGGYWLFEAKKNKRIGLSIVAGIALGTSLFSLPFLIGINKNNFIYLLPVPNGILFLFLCGYLWIKRKSNSNLADVKNIWIRSSIILIFSSFFTYSPISFKPYRSALYALNNGYQRLQTNIKMFDYTQQYERAFEDGECDEAIHFALQANNAGKAWLGHLEESQSWQISGSYTNLYLAYKCRADHYFENRNYTQALNHYLKADQALTNYKQKSVDWKIEQIFNKNSIAICYKNVQNYESADSLFLEVIENYNTLKRRTDRNSALFITDLAISLSEQAQFEYSNQLYKTAILILKKERPNGENKADIIANYHDLIKNHLQTDSLEQVKLYLAETFKIVDEESLDFFDTKLLEGLYLYKNSQYNEANVVLSKSLAYYQKTLKPGSQNIAENYLVLAHVKIALAEYANARNIIKKGKVITVINHGEDSERFANYLKLDAQLDKLIGKYKESEKKYYQILEIYEKQLGKENPKTPEILSNLADLEIILAKFDQAKSHSDNSISLARSFVDLNNPSVAVLINNAAYVNYCIGNYKLSDSLYQTTLKINNDFKLNSTASSAFALNGLGIVMLAKKDYKKANSFLTQSFQLHKNIFTENNPFTAIVYLNFARLKTELKQFVEAKSLLNKSMKINKLFFDSKHDVFADIYTSYGDIAQKEKQASVAKAYYQKAFEIYLEKFGDNHPKVRLLKEKISL